MTQPFIAINCYTIRDFCQNLSDFSASMQKLAEIGYTSVQISGVSSSISPQEIKRVCDQHQLSICAAHVSMPLFEENFEREVAKLRLWDCPVNALPVAPDHYRINESSWVQFAIDASALGQRLSKEGITLCYHNHSFEFVRFGSGAAGRCALDIIYDESDPRCLQGEIDTYWIQHGGGSPEAWVRRLAGRQPVIHLKDMVIRDGLQCMAEVGEGNLDWKAIIAAAVSGGVKALIVEQDTCPGNPFDSARISYNNLASWGFR